LSKLSELLDLSEQEKANRGLLHTPKEIAQQPTTWSATFARVQEDSSGIQSFLRSLGIGGDSGQPPAVFVVGAGTSDYIGRSLVPLLRRLWKCEVTAVPSTDLLTDFPDYVLPDRKYLWISISRSGESTEGVVVLQKALADCPNVHHLVVTCNAEGQMFRDIQGKRNALAVLLDESVNDRGLAMTSSFTNMVIAGHCLANINSLDQYEKVLSRLVDAGERFLPVAADRAAELAGQSFTSACFVGSGALKAAATECGLKLLELTSGRIRTVAEAAMGLRHGPMSVLDEKTLFVSFVSSDACKRKYESDLLREIRDKKLVRTRVAVSAAGDKDKDLAGLAEHVLTLNPSQPIPDYYRVPVDVMFGQLLGLFFSLRCGLKPDTPSPSGAINRVVQVGRIYNTCSPSPTL
jgi:tagatose-6-phosphate ketose/aldose isomerase